MTEKIVMAIVLFGGFFWLRARARKLNLEKSQGRVVFGIFGVLTALLIGEKAFFDRWHFGAYDLPLKAAVAAASFAAVGLFFLKPGPEEGEAAEENAAK